MLRDQVLVLGHLLRPEHVGTSPCSRLGPRRSVPWTGKYMTLASHLLHELRKRREAIAAGGGEEKLRARREKGLLSARDRLQALFETDTFQEMGAHVTHHARHFDMQDKVLPADGIVVGTGYVDGVAVAAFSQDFTVTGGTLGKMHARKMLDVMQFAMKMGMPLVAFKDSAGARIQEGVDALSGYGRGVLSERAHVRRGTADRRDPGTLCRRRRVLPGAHGLRHHDAAKRPHVHHRTRGHQGGHRTRDQHGRGGRRRDARAHQRQRALRGRRRPGCHRPGAQAACLSPGQQHRRAAPSPGPRSVAAA